MSTTVEIDEEKRVVTLTNQCPTKDSEGVSRQSNSDKIA